MAVVQHYVEKPIFLKAGEDDIFGIVTQAQASVPRTGFIILPGGGTPLSTNRNRLSVRICRHLASFGFMTMRCDYHGTGESTGSVDQFRLDQPFVEDISAAIDYLRAAGVKRVLLAGSCFGGRTALAAAARREDIAAVMLIATSPRDYVMGEHVSATNAVRWSLGRYLVEAVRPRTLRGLSNARLRRSYAIHARTKLRLMTGALPGGKRRLEERPMGTEVVSPLFDRHIRSLGERGIPIELLYGTEDDFLHEFRAAAAGPLADVVQQAGAAIQVRTIPGKLHGFTSVAIQDAAIEEIVSWAAAYRDTERGVGVLDDQDDAP